MLTVQSPAKINLTLEVLAKRPDDYHEIRSVMQTVDLCDSIEIDENGAAARIEIHTNQMACPVDEKNLVWQAVHWLREETGFDLGLSFRIEKRIPIGGGLGGGSSNAASVLNALCAGYSLEMGRDALIRIASRIGSDVPFFLLGGTALATGRGEVLHDTHQLPESHFVVCNPGFPADTGRVYGSSILREAIGRRDVDENLSERFLAHIRKPDLFKYMCNDLQGPALGLYPRIRELLEFFSELGVPNAMLSGSGSTVFAPVASSEEGELTVRKLEMAGYFARCCKSIGREAAPRVVHD